MICYATAATYAMLRAGRLVALAVVLLAAQALCPSLAAGGAGLTPVTILPQWQPQAQFAGIYLAKDAGIYEQYGIDMTILRGGPQQPAHLLLAQGKADFATMFLTTGVMLAYQGERLVNLAQLMRHSSLLLVAKKGRGIHAPEDLQGGRISTWGPTFSLQIQAFLRTNGLKVELLPQGESVNLFLRDGVEAVSAMGYNEYHTILNSGLNPDELTVFAMSDHGLDFPEDGLYCLGETYERDPELACNVARATLEGWRLAFAEPEKALDAVMRRVNELNLPSNRVHQRWMLERMQEVMAPKGRFIAGELTREEFMTVARAMREGELIGSIPEYEDFYGGCHEER